MTIDAKTRERIAAYARGTLDDAELEHFEERLLEDDALRDAVETELLLADGIRADQTSFSGSRTSTRAKRETRARSGWLGAIFPPRLAPVVAGFASLGLLACLALVVVQQGRIDALRSETEDLDRAFLNPVVLYLESVRSQTSHRPVATLELSRIDALLILESDALAAGPPNTLIDVEVRNNRDTVLMESIPSSPDGMVTLALPSGRLQPGELSITLVGETDGISYLVELR